MFRLNPYHLQPKPWALPAVMERSAVGSNRAFASCQILCKKLKPRSTPLATYDVITKPGEKKDVTVPLPNAYSSRFTESAWYDWWDKQGYFQPSGNDEKFVMIFPPPNVTGRLHIGHAFTAAIQDAIVRWNRMKGRSTLWIPGLDHAGIATQAVVEKKLWRDEQLTRHDIGKENFLRKVWAWKHTKADEIRSQLRRMGLSLDWSRETFTMDDGVREAVNQAFCQLYADGLISRRLRITNWSCQLKSVISDIEVINVAIDGPTHFKVPGYSREITLGYLTSFAYPLYDSDEEIVVATTRLETMLGDTAIAVHPNDEQYSHLIGRHVKHPLSNRLLPIVADSMVDMELGTGAVKITPAHSPVDHEVALRHNLRHLEILDDSGCIKNSGEAFDGMKRFEAREKVALMLQKLDLWRGQEPHSMSVPVCSRSSDIVEPRLKEQWYLDCGQMAEKAIQAAESLSLKFIPSYYRKVWRNFLAQTREIPWCISRQLWWGHNIPAYKLIDNNSTQVQDAVWLVAPSLSQAIEIASKRLGHNDFKLVQDDDVLDTWFSSALLPFACLGWPTRMSDVHAFYPGHMIESGSDILFFWIARMVMLGEYFMGKLPFDTVMIHSLLLSQGRKMSKSDGNVLDPDAIIHGSTLSELERELQTGNLERGQVNRALTELRKNFKDGIPECGADSLRMALCSQPFKGDAINLELNTFVNFHNLCNKVWQVFRFYQHQFEQFGFTPRSIAELNNLSSMDQWILDRCCHLVETCESSFPSGDLDVITSTLTSFIRWDLSKVYLECSKEVLTAGCSEELEKTLSVSAQVLSVMLRSLAPFMPFLAEELYQRLPGLFKAESVVMAPFPTIEEWAPYRSPSLHGIITEMLEISTFINQVKNIFGFHHQSKRMGEAYLSDMAASDEIVRYLRPLSRLEMVHRKPPDNAADLCVFHIDDSKCTVSLDFNQHINTVTAGKLLTRVQRILDTQMKLLDHTFHINVDKLTEAQIVKHNQKVESIKKDLAVAETCVNYLINHS